MNYPTDFNAFELPLNKMNVKQDLKAWKSVKDNDWYATNLIVNPYEKQPIQSYKRANRHKLIEIPTQRSSSTVKL